MQYNRRKGAGKGRAIVAYLRVSTEDQAAHGVSLSAQRARIAAYGTAMGLPAPEYVEDAGESAKSLKRPGIAHILERVRRGEIERLVVLKLDRLTRSVKDLADLTDLFAKHGCAFVSVSEAIDTGSAAGRMITNLLGVLAQFEREQIGERTAFALAHKRSKGLVYGAVPFGYRRKGEQLVPVASQQTTLDEMRRLDAAGASYREIARVLESRGACTRNGSAHWYASSVRSVLRSKAASAA